MDKDKVKTKEVWSANKRYLVCGISFAILIVLIVLLESVAIIELFVSDNKMDAVGALFVFWLLTLICLLPTTTIGYYIHRTKFNIYCCKLENGIDIDYIRENYCIEDIDESYVLFVDKGDDHNFCVWKLMQGYNSLYQIWIDMSS